MANSSTQAQWHLRNQAANRLEDYCESLVNQQDDDELSEAYEWVRKGLRKMALECLDVEDSYVSSVTVLVRFRQGSD